VVLQVKAKVMQRKIAQPQPLSPLYTTFAGACWWNWTHSLPGRKQRNPESVMGSETASETTGFNLFLSLYTTSFGANFGQKTIAI